MLADMSRKSDMNNVARKIEYPYLRLERRGGGGEWMGKGFVLAFTMEPHGVTRHTVTSV